MDDAIFLRILAIDIHTMYMGLEARGMIHLDRLLQEHHDSLAAKMGCKELPDIRLVHLHTYP